ncbi:MAG: hypothetical protein KDI28_12515, partial [Pseudomonadales bacterium]|nr:hypothetical protein [Pseudomonadales bacterium]
NTLSRYRNHLPLRRTNVRPGIVRGCGDKADDFHRTRSKPDGSPAIAAVRAAIADAGIGEDEIGYINAHGTSTPDAIGRRVGRLAVGIYAGRHFPSTENPPWIALPPEMDDTLPMKMMRELFPNSRIAARGNSEGHVQSLLRAGLGVGLVDCFAGDPDPLLRRYLPDPIAVVDLWLVVQVEMQRSPRVRAAMDFLTRILAEEKDLMEGRCCTAPPQRM